MASRIIASELEARYSSSWLNRRHLSSQAQARSTIQRLGSRDLERDGLVERRVYPSVPPKVEYSLTPLGETLKEPLGAICTWSEDHLPEVEEIRAHSYDDPNR